MQNSIDRKAITKSATFQRLSPSEPSRGRFVGPFRSPFSVVSTPPKTGCKKNANTLAKVEKAIVISAYKFHPVLRERPGLVAEKIMNLFRCFSPVDDVCSVAGVRISHIPSSSPCIFKGRRKDFVLGTGSGCINEKTSKKGIDHRQLNEISPSMHSKFWNSNII